ncbi:MAG: hypothetical protein A2Y43_00340 [Tenericutes bacterium GWA2_38_26]|nr:MAG: hypothetical protein A2Y43_00340 [Tenericutes bacterium GWA2_38_26]
MNDETLKEYSEILNYIISCVNLYGMIHESRFLTIYNRHHLSHPIQSLPAFSDELLNSNHVYQEKQFFIHEAIYYDREMSKHLKMTNNKPYYQPSRDELLHYLDDFYYEKTAEYHTLNRLIKTRLVQNNTKLADDIMDDIALRGLSHASLKYALYEFERRHVEIKKENMKILIQSIMNFYNHSRMWENNGFTPNELRKLSIHGSISTLNAPCPCGSGKKYKHCCYSKDQQSLTDDQLFFEDVFVFTDEDKEKFIKQMNREADRIVWHTALYKSPSIKDLIKEISNRFIEMILYEKPQDVVGALALILYEKHQISAKNTPTERIFRDLRIWGRKKFILELKAMIEDMMMVEEERSDDSSIINQFIQLFDKYQYEHLNEIPKRVTYRFLTDLQNRTKFNPELCEEINTLAIQVLKSEVPVNVVDFYNLVMLCPHAYVAISMLLTVSSKEHHLPLLKAYVNAYEIGNREVFLNPPKQFTRYDLHKEYILALDSIGLLYKSENKYKEAIPFYEKMIRYDDEDRFGAKESILICYIFTKQIELFDRKLQELPDDSIYKMMLTLSTKIMMQEPFYGDYLKILKRSKELLDALCGVIEPEDIEMDEPVTLFLEDFYMFLTSNKSVIKPLIQVHLNGQPTMTQ